MNNALGTLAGRLDRRLDKSGECWNWTGCRLPSGYGRISFHGPALYTHRAAWIIANGPIPEGMHVLHSCDNPPCCNPAHLHLGTPADNMREREERIRRRKSPSDPTSKWPTVKELSNHTGYHRESLRRLIRAGTIEAEMIGRVYLVDPESFAAYQERVAQHPHGGPRNA